jgi:hypothetical protein
VKTHHGFERLGFRGLWRSRRALRNLKTMALHLVFLALDVSSWHQADQGAKTEVVDFDELTIAL